MTLASLRCHTAAKQTAVSNTLFCLQLYIIFSPYLQRLTYLENRLKAKKKNKNL